jgi:uncharacterized protein YbbK (DUF523 family)
MDIVSACLVGCQCRYDGKSQPREELIERYRNGELIPVCPEQLGGLPTPRDPAEQIKDRLITINGADVTAQYRRGAQEALRLTQEVKATKAYLKARSPMCGAGQIYDGTFSGTLTQGDGVFTQRLKGMDVEIIPID